MREPQTHEFALRVESHGRTLSTCLAIFECSEIQVTEMMGAGGYIDDTCFGALSRISGG
jgi:hypothetical protein